jgi:long-chain fatty acid transport protein
VKEEPVFKSIRNRLVAPVLVGLVAAGSAARVESAGFALFEQGAKATAMGGAFSATADDPSAMFFNPAGNAFADRFSMEGGAVAVFRPTANFTGANPFPGTSNTESMSKAVYWFGHGYAVLPLGDRFRLSAGFWSPFGLGVPWNNPNTYSGRYLSQRVDIRQLSASVQLSAKLSDMIAIGGGPELRFTDVKLGRDIPVFDPYSDRFVDAAHLSLISTGTPVKVGWDVGLLIKPCDRLRIGGAFHSAVNVGLAGDAQFGAIPTGHADLDAAIAAQIPVGKSVPGSTTIQFPSLTIFGVAYDLSPHLTLEVDGNYTTWSVFDATTIQIQGLPNTTLVHDFKNTWTIRAGALYKTSGGSWIAGGFLYDQTPQPDADVSPFLPDANRTGGSIGAGVKLSKNFEVQVSSLFLWFHQRTTSTNANNYNGTYQTFAILPGVTMKSTF